jgi:hypothetical protein
MYAITVSEQRLTIETSDDKATQQLARVLLIAEILSQCAAAYMVIEMIDHGSLSYQIQWHWRRLKARYFTERDNDRRMRLAIGEVLFEAQRVLEEHRA